MNATMTYDAYRAQSDLANGGSGASIEWGTGWQSSLTAYLTPESVLSGLNPMVTEENGAEITFTYAPSDGVCPLGDYSNPAKYTGAGSTYDFCAPYRVNAQLSELTSEGGSITGWYLFEGGGRQVLTFNAEGQLIDVGTLANYDAETYLYDQTNATNAACPSNGTTIAFCTVITDAFNRNVVIEQDAFSQVVGILDPMGRLYSWQFQTDSSLVSSISNPDGTTSFTYTTSLGSPYSADMATVTDPDGYTRHIGYTLVGLVSSITDFADLDTTTFTYSGSCSNQSCTGPSDSRTTAVVYPDGEHDSEVFYAGVLVTDVWGTSGSGADQSQVNYIYTYPPDNTLYQDSPIMIEIERPPNSSAVAYTVSTDAVGNVQSVENMNGDYVTSQYDDANGDDLNELCWTIDANNTVAPSDPGCSNSIPTGAASFTYDAYGNLTSSTDYNGSTTRYGYYYNDAPITDLPCWVAAPTVTGSGSNCVASPAGHAPIDATAYSYDSYGDISMVNRAYGDTSWETTATYGYDADGELTSSLPPDAYARGTSPGSANLAYETIYSLDGAGRVLYLYAPGPESDGYEITNYAYDADGNVTTVDNLSDGAVTSNVYDGDNRICWSYQGTSVSSNSSCTWSAGATYNYYSYDTNSLAQTVNPDGDSTSYLYGDPAFPTQPTEVVDPMSADLTYNTYDGAGNTCVTGPVSASSCAWVSGDTYDVFDALGNLTQATDPLDQITNYTYTNSAYPTLLSTEENSLSQTTSYSYDPDGREDVSSGTAPDSTTQLGYDADGRLCYKINTLTSASCGSIPTTNGDSSYSYNPLNQLETMTDYGVGTSSFSYDANGNPIEETNDNGQVTTYTYDVANDVTCVGYPLVAGPNCGAAGSSTNTVVKYGYQYIGKISSTLDWLGNTTNYGYSSDGNLNLADVAYPSSTGETINYGYDAASNLTSADYTGPVVGTQAQAWTPNADSLVSATSQLGSYSSNPTYDGVHNWVAGATNPGTSGADAYSYQANGELESDLLPDEAGMYYGYNTGDQLDQTQNTATGVLTTFASTADGQRCWSAPTYVSDPTCASPPSGSTSYAWNAYGQLCWTGTTTSTNSCSSPPTGATAYSYDGTGLRTSATTNEGVVWSAPSTVDSTRLMSSVSCTSSSFCMAVDTSGHVVKYNGTSWSAPSDIDGTASIESVSCTSSSFCMAVDSFGYYLTFNGSTWTSRASYDSYDTPTSVSCWLQSSSPFCMAVDTGGRAYAYNELTGWTHKTADSGTQLQSVSCTSTSFCMAVDILGRAVKFNGSSWSSATTVGSYTLLSVSCTSTSFCAAVDLHGDAATYNGTSWSLHSIDGTTSLTSVSCTSSSSCQAVDESGKVLAYNGTTWTSSDIDGTTELEAVSCTSSTFCQAVDDSGHALAYEQTTVSSQFAWDTESGGSLPRLITDGTNAYIYGPTLFGGSAPIEQINLATKTPEFLSSIPTGVQLTFADNGSLIDHSSYSTYGTQTNTSSSGAATPFGFQGGYTDPTGLLFLDNRYYDPQTAQFLSMDPMDGTTNEPFSFAADDPINQSDPLGLCSTEKSESCVTTTLATWILNQDAVAIDTGQVTAAQTAFIPPAEKWLEDHPSAVHSLSGSELNGLSDALGEIWDAVDTASWLYELRETAERIGDFQAIVDQTQALIDSVQEILANPEVDFGIGTAVEVVVYFVIFF